MFHEKCELTNQDICRFGRQLILPNIGPNGQIKLKRAKVLVVGAGGLGCPVAIYLTCAGIGTLGLVDFDVVELSNLHRQVAHTEAWLGAPKVASLAHHCRHALRPSSPHFQVHAFDCRLTAENARDIISRFDLVLDCTDSVAARYLINDVCWLVGVPLLSASALGLQGQLTCYCARFDTGCYRCVFPEAPPAAAVSNCSDSGVLGSVVGTMATLQATEAVKIIINDASSLSKRLANYDAESCAFRTVNLRGRNNACQLCGIAPQISLVNLHYVKEYAVSANTCCVDSSSNSSTSTNQKLQLRITANQLAEHISNNDPFVLIDVRPAHHFQICALKNSFNVPLSELLRNEQQSVQRIHEALKKVNSNASSNQIPIFVACRRGNDSQIAANRLRILFESDRKPDTVLDVIGGLSSWRKNIEKDFPNY